MKICPYCEEDGVWNVSIEQIAHEKFKMCFECDTIWQNEENVEYGKGKNFESYMEEKGLKADWNKITKLGEVE